MFERAAFLQQPRPTPHTGGYRGQKPRLTSNVAPNLLLTPQFRFLLTPQKSSGRDEASGSADPPVGPVTASRPGAEVMRTCAVAMAAVVSDVDLPEFKNVSAESVCNVVARMVDWEENGEIVMKKKRRYVVSSGDIGNQYMKSAGGGLQGVGGITDGYSAHLEAERGSTTREARLTREDKRRDLSSGTFPLRTTAHESQYSAQQAANCLLLSVMSNRQKDRRRNGRKKMSDAACFWTQLAAWRDGGTSLLSCCCGIVYQATPTSKKVGLRTKELTCCCPRRVWVNEPQRADMRTAYGAKEVIVEVGRSPMMNVGVSHSPPAGPVIRAEQTRWRPALVMVLKVAAKGYQLAFYTWRYLVKKVGCQESCSSPQIWILSDQGQAGTKVICGLEHGLSVLLRILSSFYCLTCTFLFCTKGDLQMFALDASAMFISVPASYNRFGKVTLMIASKVLDMRLI
ncbi:hypothetical protein Bbelb_203320 [Branchiostoma belcheri]|nr:hypothetical protein Bbelb_203320 [Branchiostoma belcheri]